MPRLNEKNHYDYHFISMQEFEQDVTQVYNKVDSKLYIHICYHVYIYLRANSYAAMSILVIGMVYNGIQ